MLISEYKLHVCISLCVTVSISMSVQCIVSIVTHSIIDKAAYPSELAKLHLLFLSLSLVFVQSIACRYIMPLLFHMMMQFTFKLASNYLWK